MECGLPIIVTVHDPGRRVGTETRGESPELVITMTLITILQVVAVVTVILSTVAAVRATDSGARKAPEAKAQVHVVIN